MILKRGPLLLVLPSVLCLALPVTACQAQRRTTALSQFDLGRGAGEEAMLPERLKEISGLAMTADGRALGHDDEAGIVYEIDIRDGRVVKRFFLGNEIVRGDFEGVAVADDRVYMVTSDGAIYESPEGKDEERVNYNTYVTGVGQQCEVEGLAFEPAARVLLLPCKRARLRALEDWIVIFRWSLDRRGMAEPSRIAIPRRLLSAGFRDEFRPTAIERHPVTGTYFVISARDPAIAEITAAGDVLEIRALHKSRHRQPEGIAFTPDLTLVIADEGERRGQLTSYRRSQRGQ